MARILGLDLGSHAVKGLLLDTSTRGAAVKAFAEVRRVAEGDRQETLRQALRALLEEHQELVKRPAAEVLVRAVALHVPG